MIKLVLTLALLCCLQNTHQSSVSEQTIGAEIPEQKPQLITAIEDWQLISSSVTTASGPGVKTYMKSYPGKEDEFLLSKDNY